MTGKPFDRQFAPTIDKNNKPFPLLVADITAVFVDFFTKNSFHFLKYYYKMPIISIINKI